MYGTCGTFFMLILCSCIRPGLLQTTSWDLLTSPPIFFGKQVELRCTFQGGAPCCTVLTRAWFRGSTQIISNGLSSSKYSETIDSANNQFSLIINNLDKDDVDVNYTCTYASTPVQKTLVQNNSFEYLPTGGSCSVRMDQGKIVGRLDVPICAPYPYVSAEYGGTNFTSYLTTTIAPVTGSPKFYTISSYINTKATCGKDEKFTWSVLTGVTTTNVCDNVDLCKCGDCAGKCFGWAMLGTTVVTIVILCVLEPKIFLHFILICFTFGLYLLYLWCKKPDVKKENSASSDVKKENSASSDVKKENSASSDVKKENSASSDPEPVYGNYGSTITFKCTFNATQSTSIRWSYVNRTRTDAVTISDGRSISTTNPSHARVSVDGEYNLTLSGLQKSDEGVYRCNFGMKQKEYRLELLDKNHDQDHAAHGENASNFGPAVLCCFLLCVFTCGLILLCYKPGREAYAIMKKILTVQVIFVISAILNVAVAVPICYKLCPCFEGTDPAFIALGVGTCVIVAVIVLCCMPEDINPCYILLCLLTFGLVCLPCKKPDMNPDDAEQMQLATRASGSADGKGKNKSNH